MKRIFLIFLMFCVHAVAGTGTLTNRSTGQTITQAFFNDIHSALNTDFVGRNSSGVATSGQNLGTSTYPWGTINTTTGDGVTTNGTQTLTLKTLTEPTITTGTLNGQKFALSAVKTTTYTALVTDLLIRVSGASGAWTLTLPSVTGNSGLILEVLRTETTLANAVTVSGTGLSTTVNTAGERLRVFCDGTNWAVLDRVTDTAWTAYTPTGSWVANSTYTGFWKRTRDTMEGQVKIVLAGAPTSATLDVGLPTGVTVDTAKLADFTNVAGQLGQGIGRDDGTGSFPIRVVYSSTTQVRPLTVDVTAAGVSAVLTNISQAAPITWAINDRIVIEFRVPITGWN